MALTLNNFSGGETGGMEETSAFNLVQVVSAASPRTGGFHYALDSNGEWMEFAPFSTVSDAGNDYVIGFGIKLTGFPGATGILSLREGSAEFLALELDASNNLLVKDANDSTVRTITAPFIDGRYYYVEVYFQHQASGTVEVFIGRVSQGSDTAQDLTDGGTFDTIRFERTVITFATLIDDYYILSGVTVASDNLGDGGVIKYQSIKASATPDDGGSNLNTGNWGDAGETPLDNSTDVAVYTSAGAGAVDTDNTNGSPEGPKNDIRIDGDSNIVGMKGIWNMKRTGGGGTAHFGLLGNNVDGAARTADLAPTTSYANYFHLTEASGGAAGDIPLSTEYCRIGFETDGAQDFDCGDMWAMLLHVRSTSITELGIKSPMWNPIARHMLVR